MPVEQIMLFQNSQLAMADHVNYASGTTEKQSKTLTATFFSSGYLRIWIAKY
jgi:hypothetical protein